MFGEEERLDISLHVVPMNFSPAALKSLSICLPRVYREENCTESSSVNTLVKLSGPFSGLYQPRAVTFSTSPSEDFSNLVPILSSLEMLRTPSASTNKLNNYYIMHTKKNVSTHSK